MKFTLVLLTILALLAVPALAAEKAKPSPAMNAGPAPVDEKLVEAAKFNEKLDAPVAKPEPKQLQALPADNTAMLQSWLAGPQFTPCGFACPKCGKELLLNVKILLATTPQMKIVQCPDQEKCKFITAVF